MKIAVSALLILFSCTTKSTVEFDEVPCESEAFTENNVFVPCREYIYQAKFWDKDFNLLSEEKIWMMATGRPWAYDSEKQQELAIQYRVNEESKDMLLSVSNNPEIISDWKLGEVTGIIESEDLVWMHPIRSNQYQFTEVAPFPYVQLPLEVDIGWTLNFNIYEGWGRWSELTVKCTYRPMGIESIDLPYKKLDCWHISSVGVTELGSSTHEFWFHETYGFVKMVIQNYEGQLLTFELMEVK